MKVIDRYQLEEVVGSGTYGKVYKSRMIDTNELFAIKCIPVEKFRKIKKLSEFTQNEIEVLEKIKHPNIVRFYEKLVTVNNTYMVYEFCNGGTLESKIYARSFLSEEDSLRYFSEILSALVYLDDLNILHRDIKPANIMLNENLIKIGDFGFCKPIDNHAFAQTMVGSPIYMAPEILKNESYDSRADVWSLGVVLYEMLFGKCPYEERTIPRLMMLFERHPLKIPREINPISANSEKLIRMMLTINPQRRASFRDVQNFLSSFYPYSLSLQKQFNTGEPEVMSEPQQQPTLPPQGINIFNKQPQPQTIQQPPQIYQVSGTRSPPDPISRQVVFHSNSRPIDGTPQNMSNPPQINFIKAQNVNEIRSTPTIQQPPIMQKQQLPVTVKQPFHPESFSQPVPQQQAPPQTVIVNQQIDPTKINFLKLNEYRTIPQQLPPQNLTYVQPQITTVQQPPIMAIQQPQQQKYVLVNERQDPTLLKLESLRNDALQHLEAERAHSTPSSVIQHNQMMQNQPPIRTFVVKAGDQSVREMQKNQVDGTRMETIQNAKTVTDNSSQSPIPKSITEFNRSVNDSKQILRLNSENDKIKTAESSNQNVPKPSESPGVSSIQNFQVQPNLSVGKQVSLPAQKTANSAPQLKQEEPAPISSFLTKLTARSSFSSQAAELLKLNQQPKQFNDSSNGVQTVLKKRAKSLIMYHCFRQMWELQIEEVEENKLLCLMLIMKRVNATFMDVRISLSSLSNTFLSRFISDVEPFRSLVKAEVEAFVTFFESFMTSLHEFLRSNPSDYQSVRNQVEKYEVDDKMLTEELLQFVVEIKKYEQKYSSQFVENYVSSILDCLLVDEIVTGFGTPTGEIERYSYFEVISKLPIDEVILINSEKFRIAWAAINSK